MSQGATVPHVPQPSEGCDPAVTGSVPREGCDPAVTGSVPRDRNGRKKARVRVPNAFAPLYQQARYKILWGGRGGGKSWAVATYVLTQAVNRKIRVLCCREFQTSVARQLAQAAVRHDRGARIGCRFVITQTSIISTNGSEFIFEGLKHNVSRIRSLEGIDVCWCEEAQNVSATIRGRS